jgi:hypothetical protein
MSPMWQAEASAPGGAVTGALIVLLALRVATLGEGARSRPLAFLLGCAASYEPLTFLATLMAVLPWVRRKPGASRLGEHAVAFVLGLLPLGLGFALSCRPLESAGGAVLSNLALSAHPMRSVLAFVNAEIGPMLLVAFAGGVCMCALVVSRPRTGSEARVRRLAFALVLVAACGVLSIMLSAAPHQYAPSLLAGALGAHILAGPILGVIVLSIARAPVPFAEASAALVVLLELVLPIKAIDETSARRDLHAPNAAAVWNDIAWGSAPPASVILVADQGTMRRIASARAVGEMRADLVIVPAYDVQGREGQRGLILEPKLAPLYRDVALGVPPEELSLSQLGAERAVLATFDPKWDRALSRHLVPLGLTSRFEPEPRGASDRRQALEVFTSAKDRLVAIAVARRDPDLAIATAVLLRARAVGMAATGERDVLARALDDLRAFDPDDPVGMTLVRRIVTTKGPIDVHDLSL